MTALSEHIKPRTSASDPDPQTVGDLPLLVIARLVCEWARIDSLFPMRLWGNEMLGSHVTLGLDRWYIGRNDKQSEMVLQITWDGGALGTGGGPVRNPKVWRVAVKDLRENEGRARMVLA